MLIEHMCRLEHVVDLLIELREYVPQRMGNVYFPGGFRGRRQARSEHPLINADSHGVGLRSH
jgi:hypothetical protein